MKILQLLYARQVSDIINIVKQEDVRILLSEEQYSESVAKTIADETDAEVYVVDTIVTGDEDKEAYFDGMRRNLETLKRYSRRIRVIMNNKLLIKQSIIKTPLTVVSLYKNARN